MAVNDQMYNAIFLNVTFLAGRFSLARRQGHSLFFLLEGYPFLFVLQHFSKEIILYIHEFSYSSRPKRFILNINAQS